MGSSKASTAGLIVLAVLAIGAGTVWELHQFGIIGRKPDAGPERGKTSLTGSALDKLTGAESSTTAEEKTSEANAISSAGGAGGEAQAAGAAPEITPKHRAAFLENYKSRFKPLAPGTPVVLKMKTGGSVKALFKEAKIEKVVVTCNEAEVSFEKSQLTAETLALFYADEYADYMFESETRRFMSEAARRMSYRQTATVETTPASTVAVTTSTTTTTRPPMRITKSSPKPVPPRKPTTEGYGAQEQGSDMLKARQERVKEYEEKASKDGSAF